MMKEIKLILAALLTFSTLSSNAETSIISTQDQSHDLVVKYQILNSGDAERVAVGLYADHISFGTKMESGQFILPGNTQVITSTFTTLFIGAPSKNAIRPKVKFTLEQNGSILSDKIIQFSNDDKDLEFETFYLVH